MRARRDRHADGHRGRTSVRWRGGAVVVAAAALSLTAGPVPASAAGGYTLTATIGVGYGPDGMAVDPAAGTVYVTNAGTGSSETGTAGDGTVSVIDAATNKVKTTIAVGTKPDAVAADPAAGTIYVSNSDPDNSGSVSVINAATNKVTTTIGVGYHPDGVAADPATGTVYVANTYDNTVSVINTVTNKVKTTITVGPYPDSVAADPATGTVYVANLGANTVSVIDAATNKVKTTITVGSGPDSVAADPATGTVYVAGGAGTLSVIDVATNKVTATIPVSPDAGATVAVDPAAGIVYSATGSTDGSDSVVYVIDAATNTITTTIPTGPNPFRLAVDPVTHALYVANLEEETVSVFSAPRPVPVVTVTSSHNPGVFGGKVTFTATAAPADGGTVTFSSGAKALCRAVALTEVSGRKYHATCTTTALPAGRDTITAAYPGDASYAASASRLTQTVTRAPTALTAAIGPGPHHVFTLTATLTASGRPLSGQPVSFSTGRTSLCTLDTSTRGAAACVLTGPQTLLVGHDHDAVRASYHGNASYQASSATATRPAAVRSLVS
jgi:YVTN family beta-propeller protein